jgi:hypothetical protein
MGTIREVITIREIRTILIDQGDHIDQAIRQTTEPLTIRTIRHWMAISVHSDLENQQQVEASERSGRSQSE